jgi:hypothetical protein
MKDERKHFILKLMGLMGISYKAINHFTTNNINKLFGQVFACFLMILITLCIVSSVESYTLSVSHLPQLQKGRAFLLMTDLSGTGPSIDVSFYDESGQEAAVIHTD